jgi:hypothetical protein
MSSWFHQSVQSFWISSRFYVFSLFSSSVGMLSGPGAFLLLIFLIALPISSVVGGSMLYSCVDCSIIGVGFCEVAGSVLLVAVPQCVSLGYFAACCALCLCVCVFHLCLCYGMVWGCIFFSVLVFQAIFR